MPSVVQSICHAVVYCFVSCVCLWIALCSSTTLLISPHGTSLCVQQTAEHLRLQRTVCSLDYNRSGTAPASVYHKNTRLRRYTCRWTSLVTYALSVEPSGGNKAIIRPSSDAVFLGMLEKEEGGWVQLWRWHQLLLTPAQHQLLHREIMINSFFSSFLCLSGVCFWVVFSFDGN